MPKSRQSSGGRGSASRRPGSKGSAPKASGSRSSGSQQNGAAPRANGSGGSAPKTSESRQSSSKKTTSKPPPRSKQPVRRKPPNLVTMIETSMNKLEDNAIKSTISPVRITCRSPPYFVLLYSTILCVRAAIEMYIAGVIKYVKRRYYFSGKEEGFILGVEYFGLVLTLFVVALGGRLTHKPVMILCGILVVCLGSLLWATPYFLEAQNGNSVELAVTTTSKTTTSTTTTAGYTNHSVIPGYYFEEVCKEAYNSTALRSRNPCAQLAGLTDPTESLTAYSLICLGGFLIGIGTGLFMTSGFVYVEESGQEKNADVYYGLLLGMYGLGQFVGSCVAWWFTSYSIDLSQPNTLYDWNSRAWWLGMVVFSCILFLLCWLFLFFPKWITEPRWVIARRERRFRHLLKVLDWAKERRKRKREQKKLEKQKQRRRQQGKGSTELLLDDDVVDRLNQRRNSDVSSTSTVFPPDTTTAIVSNGHGSQRDRTASNSTVYTHVADSSPTIATTEFFGRDGINGEANGNTGGALSCIDEEPMEQRGYRGRVTQGVSEYSDENEVSGSRAPRTVNFSEIVSQADDSKFVAPGDEEASRQKKRLADPRRRDSTKLKRAFDDLESIVRIPEYSLVVMGAVLAAYLPAGYRTNVARFTQAQYGFDYMHAWFYSDGICCSIAQMVGPIIGGVIVHKLKLTNIRMTQMIISLLAITAALFLILFAFNCADGGQKWDPESYRLNADKLNYPQTSICYSKCSCTALKEADAYGVQTVGIQLEPVCSPDGTKYYSPCHAGCTTVQLFNSSTLYTDCFCTDKVSSLYCKTSCGIYGGFWVILFLAVLAHSIGQVCVVILFLRLVPEELRNLGLGFGVWMVIICAYVPGTAVFRGIENTCCNLRQKDCFDENKCWRYNLDKYRYASHGANVVFQVVSIILFVIALILLSRKSAKAQKAKNEMNRSISNIEDEIDNSRHSRDLSNNQRLSSNVGENRNSNQIQDIGSISAQVSERSRLTDNGVITSSYAGKRNSKNISIRDSGYGEINQNRSGRNSAYNNQAPPSIAENSVYNSQAPPSVGRNSVYTSQVPPSIVGNGVYNSQAPPSVAGTQSTRLTGEYSNASFQLDEFPYSGSAVIPENTRPVSTATGSVRYLRADDFGPAENEMLELNSLNYELENQAPSRDSISDSSAVNAEIIPINRQSNSHEINHADAGYVNENFDDDDTYGEELNQ